MIIVYEMQCFGGLVESDLKLIPFALEWNTESPPGYAGFVMGFDVNDFRK